jgi:fumarylacetoacetase
VNDLNATHDPARRSWVESANDGRTDFPIQNLPFCVFRHGERARCGAGIGDRIVDLGALFDGGLLTGAAAEAATRSTLNALMALPPEQVSALRAALSELLRADGPQAGRRQETIERMLMPMDGAQLLLPSDIDGYTDFLTSRHHTERHGRFKGLKDPLPPAFLSLPVAYHGRTSSIRISGTEVTRPNGQYKDAEGQVRFGPVVAMDFELEVGAFVGVGNALASPIPIAEAPRHLFGFCLLNDWSAKDIQWWEQVLGPFLGKNFMSSISPWVVTAEAMAPFRAPAAPRAEGDPPLLPHLHCPADQAAGALDVQLEAWLVTPAMRERGESGVCLTRTNPRHLYWTFAQMLTHHASNGCNLQPGDLIGSGTVSGAEPHTMACMTEMTEAGRQPIALPGGEVRRWLQDGDEIVLRARAEREGFVPIGFGECRGRLLPARAWPGNA